MRRLLALAFAIAAACASCGGDAEAPAELPPPGGFADGWERAGETAVFRGAELYGHINGGSEVFLELGFDRLQVQRYANADHEISLELYRMTDPVAALGIYLMKCGEERPDPSLEARHTVSDLQLQMVRGSLYVVVHNMTGTDPAGTALLAVARSVARRVAPADREPPLELLPEEGRVPGSERVIRGPYTLEALYTLGRGDILRLEATGTTAVAAEYREPRHTLIVADYGRPDAARETFRAVVEGLDRYLERQEQSEDRLVFEDWNGEYGVVSLSGSELHVAVGLPSAPA